MTDPRSEFMEAAFWHGSMSRANAILAEHPEIANDDLHIAAILGDADTIARAIAADPTVIRAKSGPRLVDPLTCLCFSVYLERDSSRTAGFVRAATLLLDAGASIDSGFFDESHKPEPEWESLLYGTAGVAFNPEMTRLLLERGADPNDAETPYHAPETYDNRALEVLLDSGRLTADSLTTMLLRKADFHDLEGMRLVLEHGADPNGMAHWGRTALHHALLRDNDIEIIDLLLERGADPLIAASKPTWFDPSLAGRSAVSIAARRGRGDALRSFERHGYSIELSGVEALIAACALDERRAMAALSGGAARGELRSQGATLLAEFAGTANAAGVGRLLDLGVPVDARYGGDPYYGIAPDSTALHVAAWKAWPRVVELLIARGADVNAKDSAGRTPLMLAVRACVDSYWVRRRTPDGVKALVAAGASTAGITTPTGYPAIDALLQ